LDWSQADLAARANVSPSTVRDFEKGRHAPIAATLNAMRRAIEAAGVRLVFDDGGEAVGIARNDASSKRSISCRGGDGA
jgi:transcriptional regulator with XRE-family HTH domain